MNHDHRFRFIIMDVNHTEGDRIIALDAPEDLYAIAALLRDTERYVVESIWSRNTGEQPRRFPPHGFTTSPANTLARTIL